MKRDNAIDILKCLAILLILNAHSKELFGRWEVLSTGGVIGNSLFFFCSGYTLSLSKKINLDFFNWYKSRISRIMPGLFCWALILSAIGYGVFGENTMFELVTGGGLWFISCILVYYILLYWHCRYMQKFTSVLLIINVIVAFAGYYLTQGYYNFVWNSPMKFINYFAFMLLGILTGKQMSKFCFFVEKKWLSGGFAFICLTIWLFRDYITKFQILSIIPLLGLSFFSYMYFNSKIRVESFSYKYLMGGGKIHQQSHSGNIHSSGDHVTHPYV